MQFVVPSAHLIDEKNPYKKIELAGRTCYKSENKITDDSAVKFVPALIKRKHAAMLEHACFVFKLSVSSELYPMSLASDVYIPFLEQDPYIHVTYNEHEDRLLVSGSVRSINQFPYSGPVLNALKMSYPDLVYDDEARRPSPLHADDIIAEIVDLDTLPNLSREEIEQHKYMTIRFITDRGVTHELVRHRPSSFAQESTRYVNYLAGISIALPTGFYDKAPEVQEEYQHAFEDAERHYRMLIEMKETPQQARAVLPTGLKTEIVMTTCMKEWNHVFNLRLHGTTGAPHPDIKTIMEAAYPLFLNDPICRQYLEH